VTTFMGKLPVRKAAGGRSGSAQGARSRLARSGQAESDLDNQAGADAIKLEEDLKSVPMRSARSKSAGGPIVARGQAVRPGPDLILPIREQ